MDSRFSGIITYMDTQLSENNLRSLPPSPRPKGRFRANGSHQANAADTTDCAFFEVDFGTLRPLVIEVCVGAAEFEGVRAQNSSIT